MLHCSDNTQNAGPSSSPRFLLCQCSKADTLPNEARTSVLKALRGCGRDFELIDDLCEWAARRDPRLKSLAAISDLKIFACYPRAVRALFAAGEAPLCLEGQEILNLRAQSIERVLTAIPGRGLDGARAGFCERTAGSGTGDGWSAWFPVIDFARCTGCMDCLSFCLFGVYGVGPDQRLSVMAPQNCKTDCPACARVCPEVAIIFPKHKHSPINGDEVTETSAERERVKVDISALLGGDLYSKLRERGAPARGRFSKERDPAQAMRERQRILAELVASGDLAPDAARRLNPQKD